MGRYYSGDIEGKMWVGIQKSDDASFFGGGGHEYIKYYFEDFDLDNIRKGLKKCETNLGIFKEKLDNFFKNNNGYNDKELSKELDVNLEYLTNLLKWYARFELGQKIHDYLQENDTCEFFVEK